MISSLLIIAFSMVLLVYWFRYTCLLILNTKTTQDYSVDVVTANRLKFPEIQVQLARASAPAELGPLHTALAQDYRLLVYLQRHAAEFKIGGVTLEQRLLMVDFRLMQLWYTLMRRLASSQARNALEEMSQVLSHLANAMGERVVAARPKPESVPL
jgi:hypothetical protein